MNDTKDAVLRKISMAKSALLISQPFWGYLATNVRFFEDNTIPTMATDGLRIYFSSNFVEGLTIRKLSTIIAHELDHIIFMHHNRGLGRTRLRWNYATDYAVNILLENAGFTMPEDILLNHNYSGMTAEKIYDMLPPDPPQTVISIGITGDNNDEQVNTNGKFMDDHSKWGQKIVDENDKTLSPAELNREVRNLMAGAITQARQQGKLPEQIQTLVDDNIQTKIDWKSILKESVSCSVKTNFRVVPGNKKHLWRGMILPSLYGEEIELAVAVDSSGSIKDEELKIFFSEIRSICETFESYIIHLFICDCRVNQYEIITLDNDFPTKILGRGGTSFIPVFEEIAKLNLNINCLVYFTDMYGDFPEKEPEYQTIWVATTDKIAPFGETIQYQKELE